VPNGTPVKKPQQKRLLNAHSSSLDDVDAQEDFVLGEIVLSSEIA
jgi:hypothetical protein